MGSIIITDQEFKMASRKEQLEECPECGEPTLVSSGGRCCLCQNCGYSSCS